MIHQSGIYAVEHLASGKRYIGSAVQLNRRWNQHRNELSRGTHFNPRLQNAWNKYGAAAFEFKTLILCSEKHLLLYEQRCIDRLVPEYNIAPRAGSMLGFKHPLVSRARMSAAALRRIGRSCSPETREKIAASLRGRPFTLERKAKQAAAKLGKPWTPVRRGAAKIQTLAADGVNCSLGDWAQRLGINKITLRGRLRRGWALSHALETPVKTQYSRQRAL